MIFTGFSKRNMGKNFSTIKKHDDIYMYKFVTISDTLITTVINMLPDNAIKL